MKDDLFNSLEVQIIITELSLAKLMCLEISQVSRILDLNFDLRKQWIQIIAKVLMEYHLISLSKSKVKFWIDHTKARYNLWEKKFQNTIKQLSIYYKNEWISLELNKSKRAKFCILNQFLSHSNSIDSNWRSWI